MHDMPKGEVSCSWDFHLLTGNKKKRGEAINPKPGSSARLLPSLHLIKDPLPH